jgi:hypothetical protein
MMLPPPPPPLLLLLYSDGGCDCLYDELGDPSQKS